VNDEPEEDGMTAITTEPGVRHEPLLVAAVVLINLGIYAALGALALLELPAAPDWAVWLLPLPVACFAVGWALVVRGVRVRRS
jgi:hypothetical protein